MAEIKPRSVPLPLSGPAPQIDPAVWYADGLQFACTQCGNCCTGGPGYVWVTPEDMERIANHLQMPFEDFTRTYVRQVGKRYSLTERANYDCSFLTRDGGGAESKDRAGGGRGKVGCSIYSARPMQCRTWPFWSENLRSETAWNRASQRCPGMQDANAPHYELEHIEKCRQHPESP